MPKSWADDVGRREKAGIPNEIAFRTNLKIALDQIAWVAGAGVPRGVVLMVSRAMENCPLSVTRNCPLLQVNRVNATTRP